MANRKVLSSWQLLFSLNNRTISKVSRSPSQNIPVVSAEH
jgi:hypothetical protein